MKGCVLAMFFIGFCSTGYAQNFSGQWKGDFLDRSTSVGSWGGDRCEYVLDLECNGTKVTGYSYTYFTDEGKNFYTICRLSGTLDKKKKYIEVTEIERTKTNVPARIRNCFQVHKLNYAKTDSSEALSGSWVPASNQDGNCGFGFTSLNRRTLKSSFPNYNGTSSRSGTKKPVTKSVAVTKTKPAVKDPVKTKPVIAKVTAPLKAKENNAVLKQNWQNIAVETDSKPIQQNIGIIPLSIEKRNTNLLKTLEVEHESIKIDLYDNGEIDGDSISVYYNNKLLLGKKRLSDKAITLTLPVADDNNVNELVMFAENLGTIPPNTALMVVTDGTKRYEVRITSDLQKSGTIRFVHKKNN